MRKQIYILIGIILILSLTSGCSVLRPENKSTPKASMEKVTGQYIVIENRINSKYYLIDNPADLETFFSVLPSAKSIKEHPSHYIYVIEDGSYKYSFPYYEQTELYSEWDEATPYDLIAVMESFLTDEYEAFHHTFYANDPLAHVQLMESLNTEEGLFFYYPSHNLDDQYSYIRLYYKCTDMSLDRVESAPVGNLSVDDVFIPVLNYLKEQKLLYKVYNVKFYLGAYGSTPKHFGRTVQLLLSRPLNYTQLKEIEKIMQESTNKPPYVIEGKASGQITYTEKLHYPVEMITRKDLSESELAALKAMYFLNW